MGMMGIVVNDEEEQAAWEVIEKKRLRLETHAFSRAMLGVLEDNIYKHGWEGMCRHDIYSRLRDELDELHLAINGNAQDKQFKAKIAKEAIDVANFAMFMWHWAIEPRRQ